MISIHHKTIFVHIPKCAGQSVEAAFCADLGLDWERHRHLLGCMQRPGSWSKDLPPRLAHLTAHDYVAKQFCPREMFADYFKFAVVRDPVERLISTWRYLPVKLGFSEFVEVRLPERMAEDHFFLRTQKAYLCDPETGALLVDEVVPFSELHARWPDIAERAGLKAPLGHRNRAPDAKPRPDVTDADRRRIQDIYADDYAFFDCI